MTVNLTQDYFSLFTLSPEYDLSLAELESAYQSIQRFVHPDRHGQESAALRREFVQKAAFVNEAYQTLKDPLRRGLYLLDFNEVNLGAHSNALDEEFLITQMEAREFLSEVRFKESPLEQLRLFKSKLKEQTDALFEAVSKSFKINDFEGAHKNLLKQQFLKKMYLECQEMELTILEEEK